MITPSNFIAPQQLSLDGVIAFWAEHTPNKLALEYDSENGPDRITWKQFNCYVSGLANYLTDFISKGEIVAVVCDDSIDFHVLINAIWRCGAAVLLIDRTWGRAIIRDIIELTNCQILFSHNWAMKPDVVRIKHFAYPKRIVGSYAQTSYKNNPNDIAIFATTSGTTDNPKCVAISHRKIRIAYRICLQIHNFETIKLAASLFHINSLGVLGICFLLPREIGAATRAFPAFSITNIRQTWDTILQSDVNFVYLVPPLVRLLNALPASSSPNRLKRLLAFCAAAPIQREELRTLETKYPVTIYNIYGLTEFTFAVFHGCRDDDGLASDSIGYPIGIEARVVDENGEIIVGPARGLLYLKGPMLTDGYYHNQTATDLTWKDGWFETGDIAEIDVKGRYFIRGRIKDTVLRGGVTYYLYELEHYLLRAPGVIDACAFKGRELPSGDELCVVVQIDKLIEHDELLKWVRDFMGESKVPNVLIIWKQTLPRNSNGKVLRQVLRNEYLSGNLR